MSDEDDGVLSKWDKELIEVLSKRNEKDDEDAKEDNSISDFNEEDFVSDFNEWLDVIITLKRWWRIDE